MHIISVEGWRVATLAIALFGFTVRSLWQLALAKELHKKLPPGININIGFFLVALYVHLSYEIVTSIYAIISRLTMLPEFAYTIARPLIIGRPEAPIYFSIIFLLTAYFNYILSKLLNTVEEQEPTTSINDIIALTFFPYGVWWIQPRVNAINFDEPVSETNAPLDQIQKL